MISAWGCSSADAPPDGGLDASNVSDASSDVSLDASDDVSLADATDATDALDELSDAPTEVGDGATDARDGGGCDDCGSVRFMGECGSAQAACLADPGCAAIRTCVFGGADASAACTLGPSGAACVLACVQANCVGSASAALYRTLDQCAYCTTCSTACSTYCGGFPDAEGATCPR
jgi:hypothetical protein